MTFEHPWRLLLLAVPALLAIWELERRQPGLALPLDHGHQGGGRWLARIVVAANLLPALLLSVAIVIFARPVEPGRPRQERQLANVEFLLDVSGSMQSHFGGATRYDAAMTAIQFFTGAREGDAFGLTIFGNEVLRWTPLTKDLSAIRNATPFLRPEQLPSHFGGTEIGKALRFCRQTLVERGAGDRMIVLLSDGISTDLEGPAAQRIGAGLAADGITLVAVHIGDAQAPPPLYELCRPTGGRVFAAGNEPALRTVFDQIDRMQPVKLKPAAARRVDACGPFAFAGLVLLGLFQITSFGLRWTPW